MCEIQFKSDTIFMDAVVRFIIIMIMIARFVSLAVPFAATVLHAAELVHAGCPNGGGGR